MIYVNFVCTGNICRSPMAEMILKSELKKRGLGRKARVISSGVAASFGGNMSENSKRALKQLGISSSKFLSKPYIYNDKEIVICMTQGHKLALPSYANAVTLAEISGGGDIGDPFGGSLEMYLEAANAILSSMDKVVDYIFSQEKNK